MFHTIEMVILVVLECLRVIPCNWFNLEIMKHVEIFINSLYLGDKVIKDLAIFLCFWRKENFIPNYYLKLRQYNWLL